MAPVLQSPVGQSKSQPTPAFRFLDLQPELRNIVYEFVFADIGVQVSIPLIRPRRSGLRQLKSKFEQKQEAPKLSLLLANRQILSEAGGYVYSELSATFFDISSDVFADPKQLGQALAGDRIPLNIGGLSSLLAPSSRLQFISRLSVQGLDSLFILICPTHLEIGQGLQEVQHNMMMQTAPHLTFKQTASLHRDLNQAKNALTRVGSILPHLTSLHVQDHFLDKLDRFGSAGNGPQLCWMQMLFAGPIRHFKHLRLTFPNLVTFELEGASRTESYQHSEGWNKLPEDTPVRLQRDGNERHSPYKEILPMFRRLNGMVPILWMSFRR